MKKLLIIVAVLGFSGCCGIQKTVKTFDEGYADGHAQKILSDYENGYMSGFLDKTQQNNPVMQ